MAQLLEALAVRSTDAGTFCRDEAERLRVLAEFFVDADLQNALIEMAQRFERLAAERPPRGPGAARQEQK